MVKGFATLLLISLIAAGCGSSNGVRRTTGEEPFFQKETGLAEHGKKSTIDRIYQIDPGDKVFEISDRFYTDPPRRIAILPFDNLVGGNYILNSIPLPRFSEKEEDGWNWTYANRLRRFFFGHFAAREFVDIELMYVDKMPDQIGEFSELVADSSKTGKQWDLVFISGVKGRNGELPNDFETDFRMEGMVKSIQHGQIQNMMIYNREGEPTNLFQTPD